MATSRKKTAPQASPAQIMGERAVRDLIKQELRTAFGNHSRELEKILNDINTRLEALER